MDKKRKKNFRRFLSWRKAFAFLLFFFFLGSPFALADSITPNTSNGGWSRTLQTPGNDQLIGLNYSLRTLLWTSGVVLESSQSILTRVADISFYQQVGGFYNKKETGANQAANSSAQGGWNIVRMICNISVIILLLFIAFGTILRVESYNYKYLLVKLVVVAILINFSGVIAGIVLDFNHIIMGIFSDKITNIGLIIQKNSKILDEYVAINDLTNINQVTTDLSENITRTISRVNVNMILASILMFILGITVLAVAIFLIVRTVSLWLLFTLSPVALALSVLPHTRATSLKWWDAFLKNAFSGPLLFFFLYLTLFITNNLNIPTQDAITGSEKFILFSNSGSFLDYIFLVVLLWASVFLSRSLSVAGSMQVVGYFKDLSRGDRGMRIINKIVDSGGAAIQKTGAGKMIHQWTGAQLQIKEGKNAPFAPTEAERGKRGFQPVLKTQSDATQKALKTLLNPSAVGRVLSIVDSKRKGENLSKIGGNLVDAARLASLSAKDPGEFLRTLWRRFEPKEKPTGSFWKDAKTLNETINKEVEAQTTTRRVFNEIGTKSQKLVEFQAKDNNEREAQLYKLAWTGGLPEYFNMKLGKAYNPQELGQYVKSTFGEGKGGQVAEKLKSIGEIKKDPSLSVAAWNEKKEKYEVDLQAKMEKPATAVVKPEDLKKLAPQSVTNRDEKGNAVGFNDFGKQLLKEMSGEYLKEIKNMREDTVKAMTQAYSSSQKDITKELSKAFGKGGGAVQAETIKAVGKAQMKGSFHVEEVQAPHSQISLGQEFLNRVAGRAFAGKRVSTGKLKVADATGSTKTPMEISQTPEQRRVQEEYDTRVFASKRVKTGGVETAPTEEEMQPKEDTSLKDKQKFLMLGEKKMAMDEA